MNYKDLFQEITTINNQGKRIGILVEEKPELRLEIQQLRKDFNLFSQSICPNNLQLYGVSEQWSMAHRDGLHYKPYFWNQFRNRNKYINGISIWLKLDYYRIGLVFGTTKELENNFNKNDINQKIWEFCGDLEFSKFEKNRKDNFLNFDYTGDNELNDIESFKIVLNSLSKKYSDFIEKLDNVNYVLDEERNEILKNETDIMKIKNIMLYGAPGVGKTHNYKRLINMIENGESKKTIFDTISKNETTNDFNDSIFETIKNEKRIEFVTFHQSYSYEDFIEGFRPNENGNIKLEDGIFKKLCEEANKNPSKNFYIVIDEINRGNISKIFGELITLIEEDKRGKKEYEVTLPYSKKSFLVPENLYIIATMNSTDKSIATIDIALRRRFTFLKMKPNIKLVSQLAQELFTKLNDHIEKTINEDYKLGHSYFMKIENEDDLVFVKKYKIKPLLEEYFYGDETNYKEAIKILGLENE